MNRLDTLDNFTATVISTTGTGVIIKMDETNTNCTAYGNYCVGDRVLVSYSKLFPSGIHRVRVESVLEAA